MLKIKLGFKDIVTRLALNSNFKSETIYGDCIRHLPQTLNVF